MQLYDNCHPHSPTYSLSSWHLDEIPEELPTWVFPDPEICDHNTPDNAAVASYKEAHDYPCVQRQGPSSPCGTGDPAVVCRRLNCTSTVKLTGNKGRTDRRSSASDNGRRCRKIARTSQRSRALLSDLLLCRPESGNWRMRLRKHSLV